MLYYFTGKETPSWVYQNALCLHNDFLQENFIKNLSHYKTPYLLYGSNPETFDEVDGVPDFIRHYKLVEYFYQHYSPYIMLGKFCVWKSNLSSDINRNDTLFRFEKNVMIPGVTNIVSPNFVMDSTKKYLIKIVAHRKINPDIRVIFDEDSISPVLKHISDTVTYIPLKHKSGSFSLLLANKENCIDHFYLLQYDYMPDFYSEQFLSCALGKLPYIWGQYDKALRSETILCNKVISEERNSNDDHGIDVPASLDKTSGNTAVITLTHKGKKPQRVYLVFGELKDRGRSSISFDALPSNEPKKYAVRVSSMYKWLIGKNMRLTILTEDPEKNISIKRMQITKGS